VTECGEDVQVFEDRIRTMMKIPKQASVSQRLLTKTMTMAVYMEIFAYYRRLEAQLAKGKGGPRANDAQESPPPQSASAPTADASPSTPEPDPDDAVERDRNRLRQEIQAWDLRISSAEIEHVIVHNSYSRARTLLWGARRQPPEPALAS
jgi:hypothetical protein